MIHSSRKRSRGLIHLIQGQDPIITETVPLVEARVSVCHCVRTLKRILSFSSHNNQMRWAILSPFSRWEKATFGGGQHVFLKLYLLNGRIPIQMQVSTTLLLPTSLCHLLSPSSRGEQGTEPRALLQSQLGHRGQGPFLPHLFPISCSISKACGCSSSPLLASSRRAALSLVTLVISCCSAMFWLQ